MENKYIVAMSVVLVFVAGFFVYRHTKQAAEFDEDVKKQASLYVAMARTSPIGGLTQMATALKKYEKKNGTFPATLDQLYPQYIGYRSFIDDIPWEYTGETHQFTLKKRFTMKGRRMIASIDKAMEPRIQTGLMVAGIGGGSQGVASGEPKTDGGSQTSVSGKGASLGEKERRFQALLKQPMPSQAVKVPEEEVKYLSEPVPDAFSILGTEACTDLPAEVGQEHLVWKDQEGVIGFGNVDYPRAKRMAILEDGKWLSVERPRMEIPAQEEQVYAASQTSDTFFGAEVR